MTWTEQMVLSWIKEAARTLRRLPPEAKQKLSSWPEVVRNTSDVQDTSPPMTRIFGAAPEELDRFDVVMTWMWWLEPDARKLVWARAEGVRWVDVAWLHKRSVRTLQKDHKAAIMVIVRRLNEDARKSA